MQEIVLGEDTERLQKTSDTPNSGKVYVLTGRTKDYRRLYVDQRA